MHTHRARPPSRLRTPRLVVLARNLHHDGHLVPERLELDLEHELSDALDPPIEDAVLSLAERALDWRSRSRRRVAGVGSGDDAAVAQRGDDVGGRDGAEEVGRGRGGGEAGEDEGGGRRGEGGERREEGALRGARGRERVVLLRRRGVCVGALELGQREGDKEGEKAKRTTAPLMASSTPLALSSLARLRPSSPRASSLPLLSMSRLTLTPSPSRPT